MKYTESALLSQLSGKAGSTVASHNRFGPYLRCRVVPVNTNTSVQVNARNNMALISAAWKGLTDAQRASWSAAAATVQFFDRLGRPYHPTGHMYFVGVNRTLFVYLPGTAIQTTVPTAAAPAALLTATLTGTS